MIHIQMQTSLYENIKGHTDTPESAVTLYVEGRLAKHIPYYESLIYKWSGFLGM